MTDKTLGEAGGVAQIRTHIVQALRGLEDLERVVRTAVDVEADMIGEGEDDA